ncbi:tyrosine-protein phosphatase [Arcticibacter sp.]|jgi:tyrosine-protein phosphatase YwqE|uniref:tyrosine-protein phosphatase n=1 Tax=Arcticibacter sp. TaxID=1872630 RepID=UPI00388E5951
MFSSLNFFFKRPKTVTLEWMGVDMHSHILPGIDDGSRDLGSSVNFIRGLSELGIEKFICTPHIFTEVYPNSKQTILPVLERLRSELKRQRMDVQVEAAAEYMMDLDFVELLKNDDILPLHGKYVLVEMSYQVETRNVDQFIFDLNIKGYQPVLAHPERYIYYHNNFEQYRKMKEHGCILQVNMLSLAGYYGKAVKQIALNLLKEKLIDVVGTDLHHVKHLEYITKFVKSGSAAKLLADYPMRNKELFR